MIRLQDGRRVQWTDDDGSHYVGRVLFSNGEPLQHPELFVRSRVVRLDYDRGDVIVDASQLRLYQSAPIPEPTNTGAAR